MNQTANDGITPVFIAAQFGHKDIVSLLIEMGGDITIGMRSHIAAIRGVVEWARRRGGRAAGAFADSTVATTSEHFEIQLGRPHSPSQN